MVLNIFALAFVLGITALQSVYGLFSGIIMAFSSIVAACVALGYFDVANDLASQYMPHPSYAAPGTLIVLYLLTLIVLRTLADNLLRGNVRVPSYVDWAGGAVCGFVTAQICVGVMMMSVLMLPMAGRALMYQRIERTEYKTNDGRPEFRNSSLWLNSDAFTAKLVSWLSAGSLSDRTPFAGVYPNFPDWVFWTGNAIQTDTITAPSRDKADGFKAVTVSRWWEHKGGLDAQYRAQEPRRSVEAVFEKRTYRPEPGMKLIGARIAMGDAAADRGERGFPKHRFRPTNIRVVGTANGRPAQYHARVIGGADEKVPGGGLRIAEVDNNFAVGDAGTTTIDAYFEVDQDFAPHFLEYRRFARTALTLANFSKTGPEGPVGVSSSGGSESGAGGGGDRGGGNSGGDNQRSSGITRFVDAVDVSNSGDKDDLPFPMNRTSISGAGDAEFDGALLASGRVFGDVATLRTVGPSAIRKLKVPDGFRVCQIRYSPMKAHSLAGQVFNYVARTVNQYCVVDSNNERHRLTGYYAIVKRGDREYFELYYAGEKEPMTYSSMLDFKEVSPSELTARDDAVLGLIFIVPKGVTITEIQNQTHRQGVTGLSLKMND